MEFRLLKADEIDVRIASVKPSGLSLLLYKDARCDQNLLDETVGALNWQRSHQVIDENLYCTVSIWDEKKEQWISKQDVGTESYTEKEKGQASDSFKRACFNFGIGRELYTAPFIWIPSSLCEIKEGKCFDKFKVKEIGYDEKRNINKLIIVNPKSHVEVFRMGEEPVETFQETKEEPKQEEFKDKVIDFKKVKMLRDKLKDEGVSEEFICMNYKVKDIKELKDTQAINIYEKWEKIKEAFNDWKNS